MTKVVPSQKAPWLTTTPEIHRYPALSGQQQFEYVVMGAGMAGCMAAWHIAMAGKKVALVEANHVATGDTAFSTAFVTRVPDTSLAELIEKYGHNFVQRLYSLVGHAQSDLRQLVTRYKIACDWHDCNSFIVSYRKDDPILQREISALTELDPKATRASRKEVRDAAPSAADGIIIKDEARFNPRAFLTVLLDQSGPNLTVYEESRVTNVVSTPDGMQIATKQGSIAAKKVILATGFPQPGFDDLDSLLTHRVSYVVSAQYDKLPVSDSLVWDTDFPYQYYRIFNDQIFLGGADTSLNGDRNKAFASLKKYLHERLPGNFRITNRWSGSLFNTSDMLPYAAQHPKKPNIFFLSGFAGNGIVMGAASASVVAELVVRGTSAYADLFALERTRGKTPGAGKES